MDGITASDIAHVACELLPCLVDSLFLHLPVKASEKASEVRE